MQERTIEEYCRLVDKLDSGSGVRSSDLSKGLELSKNTVTLTLQKLSREGFVEMKKYGRVRLTLNGSRIAKKMNFKHRVLEAFLFSKLGMNKKKIHEEAGAMEHYVSDDMVRRLYRFLGEPKTDPHGKRIS